MPDPDDTRMRPRNPEALSVDRPASLVSLVTRRGFLGLAAASLGTPGCTRPARAVVLYCAQDRPFALDVLAQFTQQSGIEVRPRFDTEANKSVGLYREIVAEKARPRCDVFWNNEILSTLRLQEQGLLQTYASPSAASFPAWARADDHTWHAFASRARVLLVNTERCKEVPISLLDLVEPRYRGQVVMARPQFGTTATQCACLFEVLGVNQAKEYLLSLRKNELRLAPGNKQVAEWVARGQTPTGRPVQVGVTDTDDAIHEIHAGKPVALIFPDSASKSGRMGTLFIPNTLCIPAGCPDPDGARKLVDYLLSPQVEQRLAEGPSAQIPLNPDVQAKLPPEILTPARLQVMRVDWARARDLWDEAQAFVTETFAAG